MALNTWAGFHRHDPDVQGFRMSVEQNAYIERQVTGAIEEFLIAALYARFLASIPTYPEHSQVLRND